jgi:hypothetical protein
MYIHDVHELSRTAQEYFRKRDVCLATDPVDGEVQLLLYGTQVFYLKMPEGRMTSFSFAYQVTEHLRTFDYFGGMARRAKHEREHRARVWCDRELRAPATSG